MLSKSDIQLVKSLRSKKFRQKYNQFIVEGEKAVTELLQGNLKTVHVYGTQEWETLYLPLLKNVDFTKVKNDELERLSGFEQPNKALAIVEIPETKINKTTWEQPLSIALDFVQDPGNMGTIIRIADWYGIQHIFCSPDCVDVYNPKVINATMGSYARVQVHYINLEQMLAPHALRLFACVMDGKPVYEITKAEKPIVIIGNEGKGISPAILALAKNKISIPRRGGAESLNAAVATAVVVDNLARILP
jgi:RNA methyltransferase, TrmH family